MILPKIYNGKNKTFFFHNLERTRVRNFTSTAFGTLPIPAFKQGDFSRLFNPAFTNVAASGTTIGTDAEGRAIRYGQIYDPSTAQQVGTTWVRDPFPGNIVPQGPLGPGIDEDPGTGTDYRPAVRHAGKQHPGVGLGQPDLPGDDAHPQGRP